MVDWPGAEVEGTGAGGAAVADDDDACIFTGVSVTVSAAAMGARTLLVAVAAIRARTSLGARLLICNNGDC